MRERRYVKLRVDMYEDTKFKIIDMKPERDVIHFIWNRIVLLAGKVNLEGELYLSKSIPYTIETLAIEFNRSFAQIKLALDIFIELQMLELTENNVYTVKNFAKHQNIKVKEKEIAKNKKTEAKNSAAALNEGLKVEIVDEKNKEENDRRIENREKISEDAKEINLEVNNKAIVVAEDSIEDISIGDNLQKGETILLEAKKNRRRNKNKKDNIIDINIRDEETLDAEAIDEEVDGFRDGDIHLGKDESIVLGWSFG